MTMAELLPERMMQPDLFMCPSPLDVEIVKDNFSNPYELVQFPVATDRLIWKKRTKAHHFVHSASHGGLEGRKGTQILLDAMPHVKSDIKLTIYAWKDEYRISDDPRIELKIVNFKNYWQLWREGDCLIYPQGANGICLPIVEAMASGMGVITTDIYPFNEYMPKPLLFKPMKAFRRRMSGALIEVEDYQINPKTLAEKIDEWANKDISKYSEYGKKWAKDNSWDALLPEYVNILEKCVQRK